MITDTVKVIAWDFDGVLNNNIENGEFVWSRQFEQDLGLSRQSFGEYLFRGRFHEAMAGKADLKHLVADWLSTQDTDRTSEEVLHYWFHRDARPDKRVLGMIDQLSARGFVNVVATNNEVHRAAFIEDQMGFGALMDHFFAAGRMGCVKPDADYFEHIQDALNLSPNAFLLIDDMPENTDAARQSGWQAHRHVEGGYDRLEQVLRIR